MGYIRLLTVSGRRYVVQQAKRTVGYLLRIYLYGQVIAVKRLAPVGDHHIGHYQAVAAGIQFIIAVAAQHLHPRFVYYA